MFRAASHYSLSFCFCFVVIVVFIVGSGPSWLHLAIQYFSVRVLGCDVAEIWSTLDDAQTGSQTEGGRIKGIGLNVLSFGPLQLQDFDVMHLLLLTVPHHCSPFCSFDVCLSDGDM